VPISSGRRRSSRRLGPSDGFRCPDPLGFQDAPQTHQLSYMASSEHPGASRIGLFLASTPLSYDLLRLPNVLWEQGVCSSNLRVPTCGIKRANGIELNNGVSVDGFGCNGQGAASG
jgi:hypothetical protein